MLLQIHLHTTPYYILYKGEKLIYTEKILFIQVCYIGRITASQIKNLHKYFMGKNLPLFARGCKLNTYLIKIQEAGLTSYC